MQITTVLFLLSFLIGLGSAQSKEVVKDQEQVAPAANGDRLVLIEQGKALFRSKMCFTCHAVDTPEARQGPSLFKKYGTEVPVNENEKVLFDGAYIRESLIDPNKLVSKGYRKGFMPSFAGKLDDQQIQAIIEYIKDLK